MYSVPKLLPFVILATYAGVASIVSIPTPAQAQTYVAPVVAPVQAAPVKIPVQTFAASAASIPVLEDVSTEAYTATVPTEAQVYQMAVASQRILINSPLLKTVDSKQIHDVNDDTVFYPLTQWGFDYDINGYMTTVRPNHHGTDFQAASGTPIRSVAAGKVIEVGSGGSGGNYLIIEHEINGHTVETSYLHMVTTPIAKLGETVEALQIIGNVGSTGRSTGPHLHLGVKVDGVEQDPAAWLELNARR
jgi:murein DD-endopeptidase MepM/ murein hydrolase activator NlpD